MSCNWFHPSIFNICFFCFYLPTPTDLKYLHFAINLCNNTNSNMLHPTLCISGLQHPAGVNSQASTEFTPAGWSEWTCTEDEAEVLSIDLSTWPWRETMRASGLLLLLVDKSSDIWQGFQTQKHQQSGNKWASMLQQTLFANSAVLQWPEKNPKV